MQTACQSNGIKRRLGIIIGSAMMSARRRGIDITDAPADNIPVVATPRPTEPEDLLGPLDMQVFEDGETWHCVCKPECISPTPHPGCSPFGRRNQRRASAAPDAENCEAWLAAH
jgi:hypothetical protein